MDTDTWLGAPSASASSARADGIPGATAIEHDQHMESTTEPDLGCLYFELFNFFSAALKDVGRASAPQSFSLDEECDFLVRDFFDVWHNTGARHYLALFSQPLLLKHREIFDVVRICPAEKGACFLKWCRRVHALREAHGTTTKHAAPSDDHDTRCYKMLCKEML